MHPPPTYMIIIMIIKSAVLLANLIRTLTAYNVNKIVHLNKKTKKKTEDDR